jgi:putative tricarboxylic transport membrane protein
MDTIVIIQMLAAILIAAAIYIFIGFIPGTDETSVLLPVTLVIVLAQVNPLVVLAFFISAIVTLNFTNAMPTALAGLPGGVLSSPMIENAIHLKNEGMAAMTIKKMAAGGLISIAISVPLSLLLANLLAPYATSITPYARYLFIGGAIFLSLTSKAKTLSLLSILPLAILFQSLRHLYWGIGVIPTTVNITTSFFLAITIGPLVHSLFSLLNKNAYKQMEVSEYKTIKLNKHDEKIKTLNPFKILTKKEFQSASVSALITNFLFVLSPVGLIILIGELVAKRSKDVTESAQISIVSKAAMAQSTYLSQIIIPLLALGIPLSPVAIGPGSALFNAPPVLTLENNLHHIVSSSQFVIVVLISSVIAAAITYTFISRFANSFTNFILKQIPHEAVLGLFVAFILLLAYMDAGLINIFGVLLIALISGTLNKLGVNYGVQFMSLYAAPFLVQYLL